jgi:ATP-dependent RNA circularization protein (DNA/RNA ligase family)
MIFNFFKNSELKDISKKIKSINHKIIEKLNINETEKLSKFSQKNRDKRIEEIIESLSGQNFSKVTAYYFTFDELPMFKYLISFYENNYELCVLGVEDFNGFRCDYLLSENVFRLVLKKQEEHDKEENQLKEILGKVSTPTYDVLKNYNPKKKETTKKAKKLVEEMISTTYLNEFSYSEYKKNPIRVI